MFNLSLKTGSFPDVWKKSYVTPIFKSGEKDNVANYRPISKMSVIPKFFEKIITQYLSWHCNNIINEQHGFVKGKSTLTNLLIYEHDIIESLQNGKQLDCIYSDFSKAFDKVNHHLLLSKLNAVGFPIWLVNWLNEYLVNRTQIVKIHGYNSKIIQATSGVPQGSHLGPLLFNLFINDIGKHFSSCKFLLFADDLKLYKSVSDIQDCLELQRDLQALEDWSETNGMLLNTKKCFVISFSKSKTVFEYQYRLDSTITRVKEIKDLGVTFDSQLTFTPHYNSTVSRGLRMLGFILRNSKDLSVSALRTLYMSLVVSSLQYASPVWSPYYQNHISELERVQHKFLRFIAYKLGYVYGTYEYGTILQILNILPLQDLRTKADLIFLFKLLKGDVHCPSLLGGVNIRAPIRVSRTNDLFNIPFNSTNYAKNFFLPRSMMLANMCCGRGVEFIGSTISKFKSSLNGLL